MCVIWNTTPINLDIDFTNSIQRLASTNCSSDPQHSFRRRGSLQLTQVTKRGKTSMTCRFLRSATLSRQRITGNGPTSSIIVAEFIQIL